MFFVFDGIDGAGKSTQIDLFSSWLESLGHEVVRCADPGSTPLGTRMREILLGKTELNIHPRSEMLMFSVARTQLIEEVIRPALSEGKIVVCDRFFISTLVYQGHARDLPLEQILSVTQVATDGLQPDVTFLFDLPVEVSLERLGPNLDRMESRGAEYFQKVRDGFLTEAERWPSSVEVIDATRSVQAIQQEIQTLATNYLNRKNESAPKGGPSL